MASEVAVALKEMTPLKAPSLDGMPPPFLPTLLAIVQWRYQLGSPLLAKLRYPS